MRRYEDIAVGEQESLTHVITDNDIEKFVELTGDDNKLHVNKEFASKTSFRKPVVHGMLGASFISTLIGTRLPGDGALWFSQTLEFLLPVRVGDELTVTAEVVKKTDKDRIIELKINILNQDRQVVTKGVAKVKVLDLEPQPEKKIIEAPRQKVAMVIGGTGGIGQAVCRQLAADGFHVFIHFNSNKTFAENLKNEIKSSGKNSSIVQADVRDPLQLENLKKTVLRDFDSLDVLVNCSSIKIPRVGFKDLTWNDFNSQVEFHIKPVFELSKLMADLLEKSKHGRIISIGTLAVDKPNDDWAHYITAKSALVGLTKAMAFELGPRKITVNLVSPGLTDTELTSDIPEKVKLITASQTPLRRLSTPTDVAGAVSFLASEKADFITGENIRVNGGQFSI